MRKWIPMTSNPIWTAALLAVFIADSEAQNPPKVLGEGDAPKLNPSNTMIAFVLRGKIWTMDVTGKQRRQIGSLVNESAPDWSPDGNKIVFHSYGRNISTRKFELWLMNSDGTDPHQLIEPTSDEYYGDKYPRFSPDGKNLVWTRGKQLWIMDSAGHEARPLTQPAKEYEYVGDWSPDGNLIAYLRRDSRHDPGSPQYKIWLIKPNGEDQRMFSTGIRARRVKWSNDGNYLYYSAGSALWKIKIDGKNPPSKVFESNLEQGLTDFDISNDEAWIIYEERGIGDIESIIHLQKLNDDGH